MWLCSFGLSSLFERLCVVIRRQMEHRNRSIPQLATDASSTALDGAAATPQANNDILRDIAEQMRRTRGDIGKRWQHSEGAALHAAILAGQEALSKGKSKE